MGKSHSRVQRITLHVRPKVLERDGYKCRECGSRKRLEVHHIVPLSKGGSPWPKNCKTLCRKCHMRLHDKEGSPLRAARREWKEYSDGI